MENTTISGHDGRPRCYYYMVEETNNDELHTTYVVSVVLEDPEGSSNNTYDYPHSEEAIFL